MTAPDSRPLRTAATFCGYVAAGSIVGARLFWWRTPEPQPGDFFRLGWSELVVLDALLGALFGVVAGWISLIVRCGREARDAPADAPPLRGGAN